MRMTTQRFSRPMPLLLLHHELSFGCSSFFVHRWLHTKPFDKRIMCAWEYALLYMNIIWTAATVLFAQVSLTCTVRNSYSAASRAVAYSN